MSIGEFALYNFRRQRDAEQRRYALSLAASGEDRTVACALHNRRMWKIYKRYTDAMDSWAAGLIDPTLRHPAK